MDDVQDFLNSIIQYRSRIENSNFPIQQKISKVNQLFVLVIVTISDQTKVQFTSLFSRLSYLISTFQIPYKESYLLHSFRKNDFSHESDPDIYQLGNVAISILLHFCLEQDEELSPVTSLFRKLHGDKQTKPTFIRELKVYVTRIDSFGKRIQATNVKEPFDNVTIAYDRSDRNEDFETQIQSLHDADILPIAVNLVDIEVDKDGVYYPSMFVFEPDFLYDVTAISECFGPFAIHEAGYLLRKFKKKPISVAILIGNISNFFLDELIAKPKLSFKDFTNQIFTQDPLTIALLTDKEVRSMMQLLKKHYLRIKDVVNEGLPKININKEDCFIEPSFYSTKYGIQGRLDLFSINDNNATIIELKSGSVYRPNSYGLANNHYHQTLIYDLLIESVYGPKVKRNNFILYSKEPKNNLRYAPALKSEQREAVKVRNALYLHDRNLLNSEDFIDYYNNYARMHSARISGYTKSDFIQFLETFRTLDSKELIYCNALFQFSIRELFISKLGIEDSDRSSGLASLWLQNINSKKEQFNILNHLVIRKNKADQDTPIIELEHSDLTAPLSNFRTGDLGVLYPYSEAENGVLRHQIFKVTILSMSQKSLQIRLRSRQEHAGIFEEFEYWNIEHDSLENGYYEMTRNIYEFAQSSFTYRHLMLGRRLPAKGEATRVTRSAGLTDEQNRIVGAMISAPEYFLLWGPPGTGKTSVMLREIAAHYYTNTQNRLLLLAYTNKAVDEICDALLSINSAIDFIRIGSRYSTSQRFHPFLLDNQIATITNRQALRAILENTQIYVGTIASVSGKNALFELINFDITIIDEASQILESSLIGLLSRVRKFILIGDHLQLPAIVQQNNALSSVENPQLNELGIRDFSISLFERMYLHATSNNWHHATGQLTYQGRMHRDIMSFVNEHFYNNQLSYLPGIERLRANSFFNHSKTFLSRISFFDVPIDDQSDSIKVNEYEAVKVAELCVEFIEHFKLSNLELGTQSIGVITPYRAQIAAIKRILRKVIPQWVSYITVDTVERYQGGARDIIIMSACMNYSFQLKSLVSLSSDGVDRKLNVAITRAREYFILVGNESILRKNKVYRELINWGNTESKKDRQC